MEIEILKIEHLKNVHKTLDNELSIEICCNGDLTVFNKETSEIVGWFVTQDENLKWVPVSGTPDSHLTESDSHSTEPDSHLTESSER